MIQSVRKLFSDQNICCFFVLILVSVLSYLILLDANLVLGDFGDDHQLIRRTMQGKCSYGWLGSGRFWPLGLFDYSILLLFSETPSVFCHFLYNVIVMAASVLLLFQVLYRESENWYISLFFLIILTAISSFLPIHMFCIYPERFIFFLQTIYMYFWRLGSRKQSIICYSAAWIAVTYSLFTKEPIFGMILVISVSNLVFGWSKLTEKDRIFHIAQIVSAFLFVCLYIFAFVNMDMNFEHTYGYAFKNHKSLISILISFFSREPFLICIFLLFAVRAYEFLIKSDRRSLFTDSLLFGAVAYVMAYVFLGFFKSYYIFPAIIFALPSFSCWCGYFLKKRKGIAYFSMICCVVSVIPSVFSSYNKVIGIYEGRRSDMAFIDKMIDSSFNGEKLYFFTNGVPVNDFMSRSAAYGDVWSYKVWKIFFDYRAKTKNFNPDGNILIPIEDLRKLPPHCVVFCFQTATDQESKDYLKSEYRLINSKIGTDVYEN